MEKPWTGLFKTKTGLLMSPCRPLSGAWIWLLNSNKSCVLTMETLMNISVERGKWLLGRILKTRGGGSGGLRIESRSTKLSLIWSYGPIYSSETVLRDSKSSGSTLSSPFSERFRQVVCSLIAFGKHSFTRKLWKTNSCSIFWTTFLSTIILSSPEGSKTVIKVKRLYLMIFIRVC